LSFSSLFEFTVKVVAAMAAGAGATESAQAPNRLSARKRSGLAVI
jgi:hypothetical protein